MTNSEEFAVRRERLSPTKQALLAKLKNRETAVSANTIPQIPQRPAGEPARLSFAQQRLWFLDQLQNPELPVYNISATWRLRGQVVLPALEHSLNEIVRRHEGLRTTFTNTDGEARQVIKAELTLPLPITDISDRLPPDREVVAQELALAEGQIPFDLEAGPLMRGRLLRLAADDHLLLINVHHIVSDGWSMSLFMKELAALYQAFVEERPSPLPPLPIQYADFAHWQREWLQGDVLEKQLAYWRKQLGGRLPLLALPTDRPRPAEPRFRGQRRYFQLPLTLTQALKTLSQAENSTLFMTLLAAFNVLLYRYTGQDDILIGSPIANRNRVEIEPLIGFFVNTLVLRTDLKGEPTFRQLLQRVREVTIDAMAHQDVPFEKLVEALQPARSLSHNPLFQVVFALQNTPITADSMPGLTTEWVTVDKGVAKFDMTLQLEETAEGLNGVLEYSTDLFTADTIERLLPQWHTLLESIVANPDAPIARLPLLPPTQWQQVVKTWNETAVFPIPGTIHQQIEAQAARRPNATAVTCDDQRLTYAELNRRANQLAHHLRGLGIGLESRVGMYSERSLDMVVGILAILKAGGAYVPMDPAYPAERLAFMLADGGIEVLLTESDLVAQLPLDALATAVTFVKLDADWPTIARLPDHNPDSGATADNLAYVIYTSGSTGKPKGVQITHANVARLFTATHDWFHIDENDVWTLFHSYAFDFSVWEIWGALLYGGRLVVVPYLTSRSPEAFYKLLAAERVTVLNQTPSAFRQLIRAEEVVGQLDDLALRLIIFGGEALELNSLRPWFERHGDERPLLVNMYGITETTVHVTYRPIRLIDLDTAPGSVIGRPIPDLELYLLDQQQQPVPIGVIGEIYVGGAGVARGYLNRPELTAQRFIDHLFRHEPGAKLYRSGDLGRWLPDGDVEYLGRIDHQVKVRGFRIELGEIEAALSSHEAVREVCVLTREDDAGEKRLVAYLVAQQQSEQLTIGELRNYLLQSLPAYMVPALFMYLDDFPLTTNGKIDRQALPAPDAVQVDLERPYSPPRTPAEEALVNIWSRVLKVAQVGINDNYFELGGDSIRSIQVLAQARQAGLNFTLAQLFNQQTIARLSETMSLQETAVSSAITVPFSLIGSSDRAQLPTTLEDAYPLSKLQAGMLFHSELAAETSVYHNVTSWHIQAAFDGQKLETAVQQLAQKHPVLRTSFDLINYSEPLQFVWPRVQIPVQLHDLSALTDQAQAAEIDRWVAQTVAEKFDWIRPPLLRFHFFRRSDTTFQMILAEHHAILDGWSVASLVTELFQTYQTLLDGQTAATDPAVPYREFIGAELAALRSEGTRAFWQEALADSNISTVPRLPQSAAQKDEGETAVHRTLIPADLVARMNLVAQRAGVPFKSVLLAAHLKVLGFVSGQNDVLSALVMNGRTEQSGSERALGLFLNTVPFRQKLTAGSWLDLIQQTFATEKSMLPHRRFPLAEIQQMMGGQPLFEMPFNFLNFHVYDKLKESKINILEEHFFGHASFALALEAELNSSKGTLTLRLEYNPAEFSPAQIATLASYYERTLAAVTTEPEAAHHIFSPLSPEERQQLLVEWNDTAAAVPNLLIHEWVAQVAEEIGGKTAVSYQDGHQTQTLTYAELNQKANQLAHYLQANGVGPETLVAVYLNRSPEMVIAALGVLKAGGAYLPLDPTYPDERLTMMLADSGAKLLLTSEDLQRTHQVFSSHPPAILRLCLDADWPQISRHGEQNPTSQVTADNAAYVIYTSGSTGQPKGVVVTHRGLPNMAQSLQKAFKIGPESRVLQFAAFGFDASVSEIFFTLTAGATLVLAPAESMLPGPELAALVRTQQITTVTLPPSALAMMSPDDFPGLQSVVAAGEACSAEVMRRWSAGRHFVNGYGPTEGTVAATTAVLSPEDARPHIGRPLANVQLLVLNEDQQPVPVGTPGELYLSGLGLARGYLNQPELTTSRFVPLSLIESRSPAIYYRTGDLVRYLPDGNLEFLGRLDHQVKLRGFRIELGEIEAVLRQQTAVQDALVLARDERGTGPQLVAYMVGQGLDIAELRSTLGQRLPAYMVPTAFVLLDVFPLTPNGKIDRKALPPPTATAVAPYASPRNEVESNIANIWAEVLKQPRVGIHDNFFELGGHSLLGTQVISRIRHVMNLQIPLRLLFETPTVSGMSAMIETLMSGPGSSVTASSTDLSDEAEYEEGEI